MTQNAARNMQYDKAMRKEMRRTLRKPGIKAVIGGNNISYEFLKILNLYHGQISTQNIVIIQRFIQ